MAAGLTLRQPAWFSQGRIDWPALHLAGENPLFWYRLRHDFPLAIITLMGTIGVLGILPFAIYRFASGNLLVVIVAHTLYDFFALAYLLRGPSTQGSDPEPRSHAGRGTEG